MFLILDDKLNCFCLRKLERKYLFFFEKKMVRIKKENIL